MSTDGLLQSSSLYFIIFPMFFLFIVWIYRIWRSFRKIIAFVNLCIFFNICGKQKAFYMINITSNDG